MSKELFVFHRVFEYLYVDTIICPGQDVGAVEKGVVLFFFFWDFVVEVATREATCTAIICHTYHRDAYLYPGGFVATSNILIE